MLDYGFVFVAAKDCFDGYVFAGIDAFDDLRRNLFRSPVVGRIPCDTRIARVEGLSSVVRIQQPYLATREDLEGVLEIRRARESGFTSTIWTGNEEEPSQEKGAISVGISDPRLLTKDPPDLCQMLGDALWRIAGTSGKARRPRFVDARGFRDNA